MSNPSIKVENISKRYRIGAQQQEETLVQQITKSITQPLRNFKRISSLSKFEDNSDPTVFWALQDINFEVQEGEVLGIIGHNGAGKSTLLKILSRITEPTTGTISLHGRVSALLEVGTGFHPELTGRDNIYMNGTILGMRKKEIDLKINEIIEFSGVHQYIDTPVKFYSSGMRVRLAFSVAAHLEPEILIIDEVLAVGDAEFQNKCLGKMQDVAGEGRTVLFVSHNMEAVQRLCDRCILLDHGGILARGLTDDIIDRYEKKNLLRLKQETVWDEEAGYSEDRTGKLRFIRLNNGFKFDNHGFIDLEIAMQSFDSHNIVPLIRLINQKGVKICSSMPEPVNYSEGIQSFKVHIPIGILSNGTYRIDIALVRNRNTSVFRENEVIVFQIKRTVDQVHIKEKNEPILNLSLDWSIH